jgi:hypothetical protein
MIESRSVVFCEVASFLNDGAKCISNEKRIQDFFREVKLDYNHLISFLVKLLPSGSVTLCIDRTDWQFGKVKINVLALVACVKDFHIPLYWELLDNKGGCSSNTDRKDFL